MSDDDKFYDLMENLAIAAAGTGLILVVIGFFGYVLFGADGLFFRTFWACLFLWTLAGGAIYAWSDEWERIKEQKEAREVRDGNAEQPADAMVRHALEIINDSQWKCREFKADDGKVVAGWQLAAGEYVATIIPVTEFVDDKPKARYYWSVNGRGKFTGKRQERTEDTLVAARLTARIVAHRMIRGQV